MSYQIAHGLRAGGWLAILALWPGVGFAHVTLDSPNGGEMFVAGSTVEIEWRVHIQHNTLDWDLWYSTESDAGPWQEITMDIAAGDTTQGAMHTYDWLLPSGSISEAWVRVRQDNGGQDYFDVSDNSFSVVSLSGGGDFTGDGNVDAVDLAAWQQGFGQSSGAMGGDGDADLDQDVDGADFLIWQHDFTGGSSTTEVSVVPEPSAALLLLLGTIGLFVRR